MLFIANKGKKVEINEEERKIFFPSNDEPDGKIPGKKHNHYILYKFLELAGFSVIYRRFISFSRFSCSYLI